MSESALEADPPLSTGEGPRSGPPPRDVSVEERRRLVAASLQVGNPGNNACELPAHADPRVECPIELEVADIRPYEGNPRRAANAKFAEIKASIRASGMRNPLTVTRRPGEAHFIVEAGGNSRLVAIQQLWAETREPRLRTLVVLFRPWRSESHVLTAHLIENEQRGEMTFWDKAGGMVALKARLEAEKGQVLSLRQLEAQARELGLAVNTATLAHYLFAIERLRVLGENLPGLSGLDVKTLQPRLNALKRHAQSRASLAEDELYGIVFEPVFRRVVDEHAQGASFSAAAVCAACEDALARRLGEPVGELRRAADASVPSPEQGADASFAPRRSAGASSAATDSAPVSTADDLASEPRHHAERRPARSSGAAGEGTRDALIDRVRAFAALAGIEDCVRWHRDAPRGYYLEALSSAEGDVAARQRAWGLLGGLSGQLEDPATTVPLNAAFFAWLTDTTDEAASAFWAVLSVARGSGGTDADPVATRPTLAAGEG